MFPANLKYFLMILNLLDFIFYQKWLHNALGRSVISNCGYYMENILSFLDYHLQTLAKKIESYTKIDTFFNKNTVIFAEPQYSYLSTDLSLNIFLKYSDFRKCVSLLTVSEKFPTIKSCISSKIRRIEDKAKTFLLKNKKMILLN